MFVFQELSHQFQVASARTVTFVSNRFNPILPVLLLEMSVVKYLQRKPVTRICDGRMRSAMQAQNPCACHQSEKAQVPICVLISLHVDIDVVVSGASVDAH